MVRRIREGKKGAWNQEGKGSGGGEAGQKGGDLQGSLNDSTAVVYNAQIILSV